jgi:hypothetical protein
MHLVWVRYTPNGKNKAGNSKTAEISMDPISLVDIPLKTSLELTIHMHIDECAFL